MLISLGLKLFESCIRQRRLSMFIFTSLTAVDFSNIFDLRLHMFQQKIKPDS